ncbi:hypothetical protein GF351_05545 [Candidatus Woesearchaeota archaeon]|nr:hypothetical protein [Candidatus Woesearchaeota archaeon]
MPAKTPAKMRLYSTDDGDIPCPVREAWQEFAAEYARTHKLDTVDDPQRWEVPSVIPGAFPAVGLLLYQHDNNWGNCRKLIIEAGYEDIMKVQEKLGAEGSCDELDYQGGMALPLHRHPYLAYSVTEMDKATGDRKFLGSVVDEFKAGELHLFRIRMPTWDGKYVDSCIYAEMKTGTNVDYIREPSNIRLAHFCLLEASMNPENMNNHGYPRNIRPLKDYVQACTFHDIDKEFNPRHLATIRAGKQEQFIMHGDAPVYLGSKGSDNMGQFQREGISVPPPLEVNVTKEFRNMFKLERGVSEPVDWHWAVAGKHTFCMGELSGMPHLGRGSVDAGDLFYHPDDPLFLALMRKTVEEGH